MVVTGCLLNLLCGNATDVEPPRHPTVEQHDGQLGWDKVDQGLGDSAGYFDDLMGPDSLGGGRPFPQSDNGPANPYHV